ncbi:MAG: NAD(P)H-quinone oxidoreductase [Cyanobacteria bacterium SZAS LIN-3]|nr:NAD(P)H-quinone oxidoreductase [Cyanobacteria bacterium SZAS LIN-3]MBS2008669.1 NAD(P)H-quinone oxidoreductase [Cyanobacteria bacterium SZAS TMP-1]
MQAIVVKNAGGPEVLEFAERPVPEFGPAELLIRVKAVGINRADILQRRGLYPPPRGASPDVLGLEYAGVVEKVGTDVSLFKPGDRVFGLSGGGTYQDYLAMHERLVAPIPEALSYIEAAAVPEAFITAFDAVVLQGGLTAGKTVLVSAVGSGVGLAVVQIAHSFGARIIGTSRTAEKLVRAQEFGLGESVVVNDGLFADKVSSITGGVDIVIELVGGSYVEEDLKCLKQKGRIILVGLLNGAKAGVHLGILLSKRAQIIGTTLRARPLEEKISVMQAFINEIVPRIKSGQMRPVVDKVFPFRQVAEAHAYMESDSNFGKIVLNFE